MTFRGQRSRSTREKFEVKYLKKTAQERERESVNKS